MRWNKMSWVVEVDEEGMINFPDELLNQLGWKEGDVVEWVDNEDGSLTISWDSSDPVESMLNDWTEQDFIDCIMAKCDEVLVKELHDDLDTLDNFFKNEVGQNELDS